MHEISLLNETIKTVARYAQENPEVGDGKIRSLTLQVGALNSAVPEYLKAVWAEAADGTLLVGSELIIEIIPAIARCKDCGTEFGFKETRGICSACGSKDVTLISGREFFIKEIALE